MLPKEGSALAFSPAMQASIAPLLRASIDAVRGAGAGAFAAVARFVDQLRTQRALDELADKRQLLQFRVQHTREVGVRLGADGDGGADIARELRGLKNDLFAITKEVRRFCSSSSSSCARTLCLSC